jgi:putative spermidine/putrescine transport system ATP-binding protein
MGETNSTFGKVESVARGRVSLRLDQGPAVVGVCRRSVTPGERMLMSIRPERIRLAPPSSFENVFDAVVDDFTYLGDRLITCVRLSGGFALSVDLGIEGIDRIPRRGQSLSVGWAADHCLILDPD